MRIKRRVVLALGPSSKVSNSKINPFTRRVMLIRIPIK